MRAADQKNPPRELFGAARAKAPDPAEIARRIGGGKRPPVETWNPENCGEIAIRIARDGTWYHEGRPIARPRMVKLFASILRRDGERYYLVTPAEKLAIEVEAAPFLAVEMTAHGAGEAQVLVFRTNVDDEVMAGPEHAIRVETAAASAEPAPYVHVRGRLEALIARPVFYDMVELAVARELDGVAWLGVWSAGAFFPLARADELDDD